MTESGRMACAFCRKRKLRCNREVPKCDSCLKFGYECEYAPPKEASKKDPRSCSNPSHVKKFEDRLGRVENLILQTTSNGKKRHVEPDDEFEWHTSTPKISNIEPVIDIDREQTFSRDTIRELEQLYFVYCHPSMNIIHEPTYLRQTNLSPDHHPPIFLRHAMCCLSSVASKSLSHLKDTLYQSARKHLQEAEIADLNFDKVTVAHAQTWIIIAVYELKECFMHRCLMSISRAVRLVQLLRLYRVDRRERLRDASLHLVPTPQHWLEAEERRRLFWFTFLMDRYTGISMGWPTLIDRRDIRTLLPCSDEAYENSTPETSMFLSDVSDYSSHHLLSSFAAQVAGVDLCCSRIQDLTRLETSSSPDDWTGNTWAKSLKIESLLTDMFPVPAHLTIPPGRLTPSTVFLNMGASATIIMAHRIAKFQAADLPLTTVTLLSGTHLVMEAASKIVGLMKITSHWDVHMFHPSTAFCLYVAALVYGKAWEKNCLFADENGEAGGEGYKEALRFLIDSMHSFRKTTRLSANLFEDIEMECPGMLARLDRGNDEAVDLYKNFINLSPSPPPARLSDQIPQRQKLDHIHRDPNTMVHVLGAFPTCAPVQLEFSAGGHTVQEQSVDDGGENGRRDQRPFDPTDWTVDDPDIANVARYL